MSKAKRQLAATPEYILEFMQAVYPGYAALALASFNEELALREATALILRLARENAELRLQLGKEGKP